MVKRLLKNKKGSYTLEAIIIFPLVTLILFSLVLFSMSFYQRLILTDSSTYTATQRASTWDNSFKSIENGKLQNKYANDDLYWRLFNDTGKSDLSRNKLHQAQNLLVCDVKQGVLGSQASTDVSYENNFLLDRKVTVRVTENLNFPLNWFSGLTANTINSQAEARVAEPAEFIRNFDLMAGYYQDLQKGNLVVASINSNVFHYPDCPYKYDDRIKGKNMMIFTTEEQAQKAGKRLCKRCAQRYGK